MLRGIDLSMHQVAMSAEALARQADFAICHVLDDTSDDVTFNNTGRYNGRRYNLFRSVKILGLVPGALWTLTRGNARLQALRYIRTVKLANDGQIDGTLCVLDVQFHVRDAPNTQDVREFIRTFQEQIPQYPLIIYTNSNYWALKINLDLRSYVNIHTWLARWTDASGQLGKVNPMVPSDWWDTRIGGIKPCMIQFSSQVFIGDVRSFGTLYRGTRKSLLRLATRAMPRARIPITSRTSISPLYTRQKTPKTLPLEPEKRWKRTTLITASGVVALVVAMASISLLVWRVQATKFEPIFPSD
jgi:hypothetical protein